MAKRRKKSMSRRRSKRGMGGFPKVKGLTSGLMEVAGAVGGAVAASYVTNKLSDKDDKRRNKLKLNYIIK